MIMLKKETNLKGNGQIYAINFEGGKIIEYAKKSENCLEYANIQIYK